MLSPKVGIAILLLCDLFYMKILLNISFCLSHREMVEFGGVEMTMDSKMRKDTLAVSKRKTQHPSSPVAPWWDSLGAQDGSKGDQALSSKCWLWYFESFSHFL